MGIVNISLNKGIHRSPSIGEEGELSECVNLIPRGGELVNTVPPKSIGVTLSPDQRLLAIHHVSDTDKYIYTSASHIGLWCHGEGAINENLKGIKSVVPMGNTLIINTESGLHYALWSGEGDATMAYKYLGQKPPELNLTFGLEASNEVLHAQKTGASKTLWMRKNNGDEHMLVSGENEYYDGKGVTEWNTYVFAFTDTGRPPEKPTSEDPWPPKWSDTPIKPKGYNTCWFCKGSVVKSNGIIRVTQWSDPVAVYGISGQGASFYYYFATTASPDSVPSDSDFHADVPDVKGDDAALHEVYIGEKETGIDKVSLDLLSDGDAEELYLNEEARGEFSNAILGKIEQWHQQALAENRFCYPFFIRYAYRLFNGEHFMASAPILMIPNSQGKPWVAVHEYTDVKEKDGKKYYNKAKFYVVGPQASVSMSMSTNALDDWRTAMSDWKDVVRGVDIFVSKEFKGYDASGVVKRILSVHKDKFFNEAYVEAKLSNCLALDINSRYRIGICDPRAMYSTGVFTDYTLGANSILGYTYPKTVVDLPNYGDTPYSDASPEQASKAYENLLIRNNLFYKIAEFNIFADEDEPIFSPSDIAEGATYTTKPLVIESGAMEALEAREVLKDNYNDHSILYANYAMPYNARLNLAGVKCKAFDGYNLWGNAPQLEYDLRNTPSVIGGLEVSKSPRTYVQEVYVYLKGDDGTTLVVKRLCSLDKSYEVDTDSHPNPNDPYNEMPTFFYYPDPHAYKAVFYVHQRKGYNESVLRKSYEVKLISHPTLYGAYWFRGFFTEKQMTEVTSLPSVTPNPILRYLGQIWTSPARNPYRFPPSGRSSVGTGEILAINTSAKAMSSGTEHGKFPLYAFCTDGIWPLSVYDDGTYGAPAPAVRDVCDNIDSICQIDGALLYASVAGLRLLQGEDAMTLSDAMKGLNVSEARFFNHLISDPSLVVEDRESVVEMLLKSRIIRDFAHNVIHIYPETPKANADNGKWKHYVLDLDSKEWSSVVDEYGYVVAVVPGFPHYTLQLHTGELVHFTADEDNETIRNGILLTRPMAFGEPFAQKILSDLRMLYSHASDTRCGISVYVSNDRVLWKRLPSLHAHSYKWYRFRIQTHLRDTDALTGVAVDIATRATNKLR